LETVASGEWEHVQAMFNYAKTNQSISLNKDCVNEKDRDALRIAIDNEDLPMLKLLLKYQVNTLIFITVGDRMFFGMQYFVQI